MKGELSVSASGGHIVTRRWPVFIKGTAKIQM